jgi:ABC-type Mn2+/Zn2+ transport system ATPase subunit
MSSNGIVLDAEQRNAVDMCVDTTKRLVTVTGEAGTGKTTIIKNSLQQTTSQQNPIHNRSTHRQSRSSHTRSYWTPRTDNTQAARI